MLPFEVGDAADLLARGAVLLDALATEPVPTLRWYRAASPAVVVGRGQGDVVRAPGDLRVLTRPSGGGAVLMDEGLLSLDVLLPDGHPWLSGSPAAAYEPVGAAWAAALGDLGVTEIAVHRADLAVTRRGDEHERLLAAVCYAALGRGEVTAGGRKLVGLAQRRRRAGALVQCGLLRRWRPQRLLAALGADPEDGEVARAAVGLDELVDPAPSDAAVLAAVGCSLRGHA